MVRAGVWGGGGGVAHVFRAGESDCAEAFRRLQLHGFLVIGGERHQRAAVAMTYSHPSHGPFWRCSARVTHWVAIVIWTT